MSALDRSPIVLVTFRSNCNIAVLYLFHILARYWSESQKCVLSHCPHIYYLFFMFTFSLQSQNLHTASLHIYLTFWTTCIVLFSCVNVWLTATYPAGDDCCRGVTFAASSWCYRCVCCRRTRRWSQKVQYIVIVIVLLRLYTVNHKKRDILFLTITLDNLNRFLQFLYHFNPKEILHATVVKCTTSP